MQGGGFQQFAAVPLNLLGTKTKADYVVSGSWSRNAAKEARKYCDVHIAASSEQNGTFTYAPEVKDWDLSPEGEAAYVYLCVNETVNGGYSCGILMLPFSLLVLSSSSFLTLCLFTLSSQFLSLSLFPLLYATPLPSLSSLQGWSTKRSPMCLKERCW